MFRTTIFSLLLAGAVGSPVLAGEPEQAAGAAPAQAPADHDAASREYFSDMELVTQDGETVRFYSDVLRDQIVVINFIFTNCGDACPMITHSLATVSEMLGEDRQAVRFVSISIDPERDSPEAMKAFAQKHGADQPGWLFLTGEPERVNYVVKKLGQYSPDVEAHSTLILAANVREKHWMKIPPHIPPEAMAEKVRLLVTDKAS